MNQFQPDLIIEATSVCDRACSGCYAPNVVSAQSATDLYRDRPNLFLNPETAREALSSFSEKSLSIISLRGGEPSLHPELATLLQDCVYRSDKVVLETHGRWLLPKAVKEYAQLVAALSVFKVTVKISFDKMHGLTIDELRMITQFLDWNFISFSIAITEKDYSQFRLTKNLCSWISDDDCFIFQKKATSLDDLVCPPYGVLGIDGQIHTELSTRQSFRTANGLAI